MYLMTGTTGHISFPIEWKLRWRYMLGGKARRVTHLQCIGMATSAQFLLAINQLVRILIGDLGRKMAASTLGILRVKIAGSAGIPK